MSLRKYIFSKLIALVLALSVNTQTAQASELLAPLAIEFIDFMVTKHGFARAELDKLFRNLTVNDSVVKLISPPSAGGRPKVYWSKYRSNHVTVGIVGAGVQFIRQYNGLLARAEDEYGVDKEIIAAIIGIETRYGRVVGNYSILRAIATLGLAYEPRAKFFVGELEQLLLLARETNLDLADLKGSYAGAMGLPQFLPSSVRKWAVDFDGNGSVDLFSPADAIGSVANFLKQHGWSPRLRVAFPVKLQNNAVPTKLISDDILPKYTTEDFASAGIEILQLPEAGLNDLLTLVDLEEKEEDEYRAGTGNYYVITRYNRSNKYAMAVYDLSQELAKRLR